jgi:DNA replication protein DnaC
LIDSGKIKEARRQAFRLMNSEHQADLIEMFKEAGDGTFVCHQCGTKAKKHFISYVLMYDGNHTVCDPCVEKIQEAVEKQKTSDKLKALERFEAQMLSIIDSLISTSGVPVAFKDASMRDLDAGADKAFVVGKSYFLHGGVGVGKSHTAVALIRQYLESLVPEYDEQRRVFYVKDTEAHQPIFIEVPELLLRIRDTYSKENSETEKDIVDHFTKTPFLVLDDLGSEKASEFSTLMIYLIINRRCTSGKTTVITSNLTLEEIGEHLSSRVSSRIRGMCQEYSLSGNDKRYHERQG